MNKILRYVIGALLIAFGVIYALNVFGLTDIDISLDGWWTLFIIIPCLGGLIRGKDKLMSAMGLIVGVLLLLAARDIFDYDIVWKLLVPTVIVLLGIKLIIKDTTPCVAEKNDSPDKESMAAFCSKEMDYSGEEITLSKVGAIFGGTKCNLTNAVIKDGSQIDICCIFGGADIIVPENVNIKINTFCLFGGIADKRNISNTDDNAVTLNINGFCLFGGADIK